MLNIATLKTSLGDVEIDLTEETATSIICLATGDPEIIDYNYEVLESYSDSSLRLGTRELHQKVSSLFSEYHDLAVTLGYYEE